jgi:hypothetical protein
MKLWLEFCTVAGIGLLVVVQMWVARQLREKAAVALLPHSSDSAHQGFALTAHMDNLRQKSLRRVC